MKKILLSLLSIGAVAVVAVAATGAFFSDTETSTGNTFTAGSVDLKVDSACHYYQDGQSVACSDGDFNERNLTNEKFFDFHDVKPGDYGENTISLHVVDNDAWACVTIGNMGNDENTCNDPELEFLDTTCDPSAGNGELAQNLEFFAWSETDGDNIFEGVDEFPLFDNLIGPASDVLNGITYRLADSTTLPDFGPLVESTTYYIGVAWCAGTMTPMVSGGNMPGGLLNCNGSTMLNDTQTDSLTADISFYVEQSRNNPGFTCESL